VVGEQFVEPILGRVDVPALSGLEAVAEVFEREAARVEAGAVAQPGDGA
jgi:hypothetical protein